MAFGDNRKPLARHTELKSGKGPSRSTKPMRQRSKKGNARAAAQKVIRLAVFERDGHRCQIREWLARADLTPARRAEIRASMGECFGELTPHHLKKQSQGGKDTMTNETSLCVFHNDTWVEDHPTMAHEIGLTIRTGDDQ